MWMSGLILTIGVYLVSKSVYRKIPRVWLSPMLVSLLGVIAVLLALSIPYAHYDASAGWLTGMLGPATVAFAVPLYRHFATLRRHLVPILTCLLAGTAIAITVSVEFGKLFGLDPLSLDSLVPRSVTTPIAMDVSSMIGGSPVLTAAFVTLTGTIGMIVGPVVIRWLRLKSPLARGAVMGMGAHGIGTARAFEVSVEEGTYASLAMIVAGIFAVLLTRLVLHLLG